VSDAPGARVPDFFLVGHPKSGTTALWEMLRSHPEIFMSEEKELWYFSPELKERQPPRKPFALPNDIEHYRSLFAAAGPGQRTGEASTTYLWSPSAAGLIAAERPDARIIAILREPASFLRSLHLQYVESYIETEADFGRALALEPARREGREIAADSYWPQLLLYSDHIRYAEQLRRYREHFPAEQVRVLIYDDVRADTAAAAREVLEFVGVDPDVALVSTEANPSVEPRSIRVHQMLEALTTGRGPVAGAVKRSVQAVVPRATRKRALDAVRSRTVREPSAPDERVVADLRDRARGEVELVSALLDRDLVSLWGYDSVD